MSWLPVPLLTGFSLTAGTSFLDVTLFRTSRLRGKCEALLVVDLSASVSSGTTWEVDEHGMYCSNDVPLPPSHLHSAYTFKAGQVLKAWTNDTVPSPPHPSLAPTPIGPALTLIHLPMTS